MAETIRTSTFACRAADFILQQADQALAARGVFRLALSGGNTPKAIYQEIAARASAVSRWIITFGDERCVPPDDAQSNFQMAAEAWLKSSDATVLRMKGELEPHEAALDYERQLSAQTLAGEEFVHDLVLLGMGDDGHTASLFPGTAALAETERRVVANFVPKVNAWRLTFTFPFLNASRNVVFLVNDAAKEPLVAAIQRGGTEYPSERIQPVKGKLFWLLGEH